MRNTFPMKYLAGCLFLSSLLSASTAQAQWIYQIIDKETNETYILKKRPQELDDRFHMIIVPDQGQQPTPPSGYPVGYKEKWTTYYDPYLREKQKQTQLLNENNQRLKQLQAGQQELIRRQRRSGRDQTIYKVKP